MANELFRKQLPFANRDPIGLAVASLWLLDAAELGIEAAIAGGLAV